MWQLPHWRRGISSHDGRESNGISPESSDSRPPLGPHNPARPLLRPAAKPLRQTAREARPCALARMALQGQRAPLLHWQDFGSHPSENPLILIASVFDYEAPADWLSGEPHSVVSRGTKRRTMAPMSL